MKCEKCHDRNATFFFERNINGERHTYHLCHACAEEIGLLTKGKPSLFEDAFSPLFSSHTDLIDDIFGLSKGVGVKTKKCEGCGATWQEIANAGRVGCPLCYGTFEGELEHSIRSMHGNVTHVGRAPAKNLALKQRENMVSDLKKALQAAIEGENFEEAARLRDEIRAITEKKGE